MFPLEEPLNSSNKQKQITMKIRLKKKRLYLNLVLAIMWIGLAFIKIYDNVEFKFSHYLILALGILYIFMFLYDFKNQYLTVDRGTIRKNMLYGFGRGKIDMNEIKMIKKVARNYILKTENTRLKINTDLIEENSLTDLNKILANLNLPSDRTPFINTV